MPRASVCQRLMGPADSMVITFLCPAGHKLTSPPELAGKPGKCPRCGATFRVPIPEPDEPAKASDEASGQPAAARPTQAVSKPATQPAKQVQGPAANQPGAAAQPAGPNDAQAAASVAEPEAFLADDETEQDDSHIVFLCPNGHRLHGPASLAGQPGQCPQCGIKFLVPSPDEEAEEELVPDEEPLSHIQIKVDSSPRGSAGLLERLTGSGSQRTSAASAARAESAEAAADSLPALFRLLWACKEQGGLIEVHLSEGKVVVPERFASHLSNGEHAVFGLREAGGTHSVTVVPWSAITHVALRGLAALPRAIFEPGD